MSEKTIPENVKSFVAKQILHYLDEDPDKALPHLLSWADKFDKDNLFPQPQWAPTRSLTTRTTTGTG